MLVSVFFHINEIDNNQARKISKTQLASEFFRCLKVGFQRGSSIFRSRVDFPESRQWHKCFGLVDHKITTRLKCDLRTVDRVHLIFRIKMLENWLSVIILFNLF